MMRWLFFALLFGNGIFWFWHYMEADASVPAPVHRQKVVNIPLLTEVQPPAELVPAVPDKREPASVNTAPPEPVPPSDAAPATSLPSSEPTEMAAEPAQTTAKPELAAADKTPAEEPEPAPKADPVPETVATESRPAPEKAPESESPVTPAAPTPACYRIGPLLKPELAAEIETRVRSQGWPTTREERRVSVASGFLVYWPPLASRQAALEKMRELRAQGIDSFVVGDGPYLNGLSLGLFSSEDNAKRHAAGLRGQGLEARVGTRQRDTMQVFLEFQAPDERVVAGLALAGEAAPGKISCR